MAGFIDSAVQDIDNRLRELKEEEKRLEAAKSALLGNRKGPGRPARASSAAAKRGPGRPRGRRGGNTRSNQALELVRSQPGITIPQIAESLKIEPNYLYRVMPKLTADKLIRRDGAGWYPVADSGSE
jgi:hypothetical protein